MAHGDSPDDPRSNGEDSASDPEVSRAPDAGDHRVGDILSGRVSSEELDPVTIAELSAWFGAPAQSIVAAERAATAPHDPPPHPDDDFDDPELRELWKNRRRAMDAVDPVFLARLESRTEEADEYVTLPEPPPLHIEQPLDKFDIHAWRFNFLDIREREIDEDLYDALRQRAPQAVLRDLHRPVLSWPLVLIPTDMGVDIAGQRSRSELWAIMTKRYDTIMQDYEVASRQGRRGLEKMRARLAEPWEDSYIPESERGGPASSMPTAEDLKWFGSVGYDPFL